MFLEVWDNNTNVRNCFLKRGSKKVLKKCKTENDCVNLTDDVRHLPSLLFFVCQPALMEH